MSTYTTSVSQGQTVSAPSGTTILVLQPVAVNVSFVTIELPPNPRDGQQFVMKAPGFFCILNLTMGTVDGSTCNQSFYFPDLGGSIEHTWLYSFATNAWAQQG